MSMLGRTMSPSSSPSVAVLEEYLETSSQYQAVAEAIDNMIPESTEIDTEAESEPAEAAAGNSAAAEAVEATGETMEASEAAEPS